MRSGRPKASPYGVKGRLVVVFQRVVVGNDPYDVDFRLCVES